MIRKIVATILILTLSVLTVACDGGNSPVLSGSSQPVASTDSAETIKIGVLEDQTGEFVLMGNQKLHAAQLAVAEINAAGGLLGRQVEIVAPDAQSSTQRAQEMAKKLVLEDKVAATFGPYTSAAREAIRPVFEENKALLFYNNQYEGGVASHYVFCTGAVPEQQVVPLVDYMMKNFGKSLYVIVADYNFGWICEKWFQRIVEDNGGTYLGVEFIPLEVSQFASTISKIQAADPDILVPMLAGTAQSSFFEQWANTRTRNIPMASSTSIAQSYDHKRFAPPALSNMYISPNYVEEIDSPASNAFRERWYAMFPDDPYIGMEAEAEYVGVHLWAKAVAKAGTIEVEAVIKALESGEIAFDAPSGKVTVDPKTHHCIRTIYLMYCDENHNLTEVAKYENMEPYWLSKEMGIDLTKEAPNAQFSLIDD